ncbi:MAG: hypothetical protein QNI92_18585, partial [Desulfobacterales bacterium]|nr:hypothetical protein [Desulfobacterales bacterium]
MKTTVLRQKLTLGLVVLAIFGFGLAATAAAQGSSPAGGGKFSITEAKPELFYSAMRYDKFFG